MALTLSPIIDYTTLLNAIAVWADRSDFAAVSPTLVGLAHARLNRVLRVGDMAKRSQAALLAGTSFVDLPDDFIEMIRVTPLTSPPSRPLESLTIDQQGRHLSSNITTSQVPTAFARFGASQIEVSPAPTGAFTIEILYYGQIPALTVQAPTNWVIAKWPEAYLYGALVESAPYLRDDDRMTLWKSRFEEILNEIQGANDRAENAGGRMINRSRPMA